VNTVTDRGQRKPAVAMDDDGDFVIAWQGEVPNGYFIHARRYRAAGQAVPGEIRVNAVAVAGADEPAVAMDPDGDFVVAWHALRADVPGWGIYAQRYGRATTPPRLAGVFVGGTAWAAAFGQYLEARGLGSAAHGFAVGAGGPAPDALPWGNLDRITLVFDAGVIPDRGHLLVEGVSVAEYRLAGFTYDPATRAATWTLGQGIVNERVRVRLADDVTGTELEVRFNVLSGDVDRSGSVNALDVGRVRSRVFARLPVAVPTSAMLPLAARRSNSFLIRGLLLDGAKSLVNSWNRP
jgi:hypothetical protein